ncbi:MAG: 50S ribosomal protein L6 [Bacteroidetes bacterium]|nr:50S ribosomal protein L6 [Bacteroidota bacterium]MBU1720702.1 50S ribosomal protein L6 [Bacteroidota bacterium]
MSRIGKLPITIPQGVTITVGNNNVVVVKGKIGELSRWVDPCITLDIQNDVLTLSRESEQNRHKALHGLYRALLANMVHGVSEGFRAEQELIGVGYKAEAKGQMIEFALGYSHPIHLELPPEVKAETISDKGKAPRIILTSHDKELLGMVTAKIRSFRKPEPYKGKGIRFAKEIVRKKAGKSASS